MRDVAVAAATVGLWLVAYACCRGATRTTLPPAGPPTMDLGPEPPAVVSLLVNGWSTSAAAAESTVLDLAAAHYYELRQPDADPYRTTIHLSRVPLDDSGLRPYERQVLDRIRGLAVDGVVPIGSLRFRDKNESRAWNKQLRAAVVADARAAGLSRRRFGRTMMTVLYLGAVVAGLVCGWAAAHATSPVGALFPLLPVAGTLAGLVQRIGERHTPAGARAAARWLGVQAWLRGHRQFAELPPSAVMLWDRYLAYGAALRVTARVSDVLDLEVGVVRGEPIGTGVRDIFGEARPAPSGPPPVPVDDVARIVGRPVYARQSPQRVEYRSVADDALMLRVEWAYGTSGRLAWQLNGRGHATPLPGIGDGAYAVGHRVVMRAGELTVLLIAVGAGQVGTPYLPWLLSRCAVADGPAVVGG
jgi:hypothetical protein